MNSLNHIQHINHLNYIRHIRSHFHVHGDFWLFLILFSTFRLGAAWFFRPGGYIRDYSDMVYYQSRASWQDFGFFPYIDYWSEYPPLFTWYTVWIERLTHGIPLWEDARLWFAILFGTGAAVAETIVLLCLYWFARRLYGAQALRVCWLYAGLFLPVYLLGGWFESAVIATIWLALVWMAGGTHLARAIGVGIALGIGGLLKLVPLAMLAALPLVWTRLRNQLLAGLIAVLIFTGGYAIFYYLSLEMTTTSVRSLADRSGWSTIYALLHGYVALGAVIGDEFDAHATMALYEPWLSTWVYLAPGILVGAIAFLLLWRRESLPIAPPVLVRFAALTYALLLLVYPAWNPQYALYLLPFIVLIQPNGWGVFYALGLSFLTLLEHPVYFNLIGPEYAPEAIQRMAYDYRPLLTTIIIARTLFLFALALHWFSELMRRQPAGAIITPRLAQAIMVVALLAVFSQAPGYAAAYREGRLATSPLRTVALYLEYVEPAQTVVLTNQDWGRELRAFLSDRTRVRIAGGDPAFALAQIPADAPFLFLHAAGDPLAAFLAEQIGPGCTEPLSIDVYLLRRCNSMPPAPAATLVHGIELLAARQTPARNGDLLVTLFWHGSQAIEKDYTVFVHIVNREGDLIGQWDQIPAAGAKPTTSWTPAAVVVDDYRITLQTRISRAALSLVVGLYEPETGMRVVVEASELPVDNNGIVFAHSNAQ